MYKKGVRLERELLRLFWGAGFAAIRTAGSGKANFPTPDLLVGKAGKVLAIECKSSKDEVIYLEPGQVEDLKTFAETFGAEAYVAARFNQEGWLFLRPGQLEQSPTKLKLTKGLAMGVGKRFDNLTSETAWE